MGQGKDGAAMVDFIQVHITPKQKRDLDALREKSRVPTASRVRDAIELILHEARADGLLPPLEIEEP